MGTPAVPFQVQAPTMDFSIQQAIDRALAALPASHTWALVAHVDNGNGTSLEPDASVSVAYKVADEWKLEAAVVKDYSQPFKYGAEVIWSR